MDITKLKNDLMLEAETMSSDIYNYCLKNLCESCDLYKGSEECLKNRLFIAICDGYALASNNPKLNNDINIMLKNLYPNFYRSLK